MYKALKFFGLILIGLFLFSSCDEFPKFEGTYTGILTITYQTYDYVVESAVTIVVERSFKDIISTYSTVFGSFGLGGRIDNQGYFAVNVSGINDLGTFYIISDVGQIDLSTGIYTSNLTVTEDDNTTITATLYLQKQ